MPLHRRILEIFGLLIRTPSDMVVGMISSGPSRYPPQNWEPVKRVPHFQNRNPNCTF